VTARGAGPIYCSVDETLALGLLREMVDIPSPSYEEAELAGYLETTLRDFGFDTHVDAVGNLIAEVRRGPGPTVLLIGHMDTVPGHIPVHVAEGRLYGRGAVDAKGPLATLICAALRASRFRGLIRVVGAVQEETACSLGAMRIRETYAQPDFVVVGEPSGWSSVVLGYKGKLDLRYQVRVEPTHPSNPDQKASEAAVEAWNLLLEELGMDSDHSAFDRPGATLSWIRGDLVTAQAEFSIRTPIGFDAEGFVNRLRARLGVGVLQLVNHVAACRVDRKDPVVRAISAGIRSQGGIPALKVKTATSDMNTLAEVWNMPIATYGPGDSRLDHADDEHILVADYCRGIGVLTSALEGISEAAKQGDVPRGVAADRPAVRGGLRIA
jgi:LysW-gamma-L-lysine carboxypeptidase